MLIGGDQGGPGMCTPLSIEFFFMHFLGNKCQNNRSAPPFGKSRIPHDAITQAATEICLTGDFYSQMYDHILELEREVFWIYGNVTCAAYPLQHIDTISERGEINTKSAMYHIVYGVSRLVAISHCTGTGKWVSNSLVSVLFSAPFPVWV